MSDSTDISDAAVEAALEVNWPRPFDEATRADMRAALSAARPHLVTDRGEPSEAPTGEIDALELAERVLSRPDSSYESLERAIFRLSTALRAARDALAPAAGQLVEIKGLAAEIAEAVMGNDHLMHVLDQQQRDSVQHDIEIEARRVLRRAPIPERVNAVVEAANRYLLAVSELGKDSGYNKLSFFEAPLINAPPEVGTEGVRRWRELNDTGVSLKAALASLTPSALAHLPRDRKGE